MDTLPTNLQVNTAITTQEYFDQLMVALSTHGLLSALPPEATKEVIPSAAIWRWVDSFGGKRGADVTIEVYLEVQHGSYWGTLNTHITALAVPYWIPRRPQHTWWREHDIATIQMKRVEVPTMYWEVNHPSVEALAVRLQDAWTDVHHHGCEIHRLLSGQMGE